jgi:SAM-dependent methyltransferase
MSVSIQCPVCSSGNHSPVDRFGELTFLRCSKCTLEFCYPSAYDRETYNAAYKAGATPDFYVPSVQWLHDAGNDLAEARWMLFAAQIEALDWLQSNHAGVFILDIGCGPGWFLIRAQQLGFRVAGVEVGSEPVRALCERGYNVVCGSIESVPQEWSPQVITVFEVLEHLPDPVNFLLQIRNRFPASLLVLTVPSPKRWTKAGHHRDLADFPPNNLTRWNPASLVRALSRAGYNPFHVGYSKPLPLETAAVSIRGLWRSWTSKMPDRLIDTGVGAPLRHLKREVRVRKWKCVPGFLCSSIFRRMGWSGISMLAIARPEMNWGLPSGDQGRAQSEERVRIAPVPQAKVED